VNDTLRGGKKKPAPIIPAHPFSSYSKPRDPVEAYLTTSSTPACDHSVIDSGGSYDIEDGRWVSKIPRFHLSVPSYSQRTPEQGDKGEYTVFEIVSTVASKDANASDGGLAEIAVYRRYTHFQRLHTILKAAFPLINIPDLPERRFAGRFSTDFLDVRRRDFERYLRRIARHELVRCNRTFLDFLSCEDNRVCNVTSVLLGAVCV